MSVAMILAGIFLCLAAMTASAVCIECGIITGMTWHDAESASRIVSVVVTVLIGGLALALWYSFGGVCGWWI